MKVVHVTPAVFGAGKRGGGERYVSELVHAQRALGINVTTIEIPTPWTAVAYGEGTVSPISIGLTGIFSRLRGADIVHVHQLNTSAFDIASVARLFSSFRLVLTDHGGGNVTPGRALGSTRLKLVDGAAFVSNWSRADVDRAGSVRPYAVVYGGGDHIPSEGVRAKTEFDFGFVGRLLPHKGAHVAIDALPPEASLLVAGEARDVEYLAYLKSLADGKRVTFRHDLPDTEMARTYQSFRYLVVPSVKQFREKTYARPELLGLVALEALCHGTPVIGSDVGGLGEFLKSASQTVVVPGDTSAWGVAMSEAMKVSAAPVQQEPFSWRAVALKCLDLYSAVLASS